MRYLRKFESFFDSFDESDYEKTMTELAYIDYVKDLGDYEDEILNGMKLSYDKKSDSVHVTYYDEYTEDGELVSVDMDGYIEYELDDDQLDMPSEEEFAAMDDEDMRYYMLWVLDFDMRVLVGDDDIDVSSYLKLENPIEYEASNTPYRSSEWLDIYGVLSRLADSMRVRIYDNKVVEYAAMEREKLLD